MKLEKDTTISHYKILSKIGKGGMGEVYLAEDTKLDRQVALKILPAEFAEDKDRMNRFIREAKSASALNHPNIITIHEINEIENIHYIATEFIDGKTLSEYATDNLLNLESVLKIAIQTASALDVAHVAGIVHRDIKPDNVMIRPDGFVKILDFGIAKLSEPPAVAGGLMLDKGIKGENEELKSSAHADGTDPEAATAIQSGTLPGMIIGTANYMSPEQAKGKEVDARSDIFSFGVVLYEMIAGQLPFAGDSAMEMIGAILHKEPKPLDADIPIEIGKIVDKCLIKDRNQRYQTIESVLADLKKWQLKQLIENELQSTSTSHKRPDAETQIFKVATDENVQTIRITENSLTNSIAVMPFTNMSADEENEYFCDGLAEELLNALTKIEDLKVAARTSAFSFKGKNANVSEIGNKLGVKNVLEGSVRKSGDKLRISVRLENAADGYQLWAESYDREMKDIFDIQDEIALAVVDALKIQLFGDEKESVTKRFTNNAAAYQLYLKGRYHFARRTIDDMQKGLDYFGQALEVDPEYALAYVGIADIYNSWTKTLIFPAKEVVPQAKSAAKRALEIDPKLAEAHASLADSLAIFDWNWEEAEREFKFAFELNPRVSFIHFTYGISYLVPLGRSNEAITELKRAVELEPLSLIANTILAEVYLYAREYEKALDQAQKAFDLNPNFTTSAYWLGQAYLASGMYDEAIALCESSLQKMPGFPVFLYLAGLTYAKAGRRREAEQIIEELREISKTKYVQPYSIARIYTALDEKDKAFGELEKAFELRDWWLPRLKTDPLMDPLRSDPRFNRVLQQIGLPPIETPAIADGMNDFEAEPQDDLSDSPERQSLSAHRAAKPRSFDKRLLVISILLAVIAIGGFLGYRYFYSGSKQIESIAVMPFVNESGNEDVEYLSDGMTETLISSLSNLPNLNVKPRSSVFRYKGKKTDPQTIAKELDVQAILNGRVVQRGEDISLFVELTDISLNKVIWSETYNRKQSALVTLQSEIAKDVSTKLKAKLSGADEAKVTNVYTTNSEAYQLYLKGNYFTTKLTKEGFRKGNDYFEQAIRLDPKYALAYNGIAFNQLAAMDWFSEPKVAGPKAKSAVEKAIALDDKLAETHLLRGMVAHWVEWDWKTAESEFKKAIELDPSGYRPYGYYAWFLANMGRNDEAIASATKGQQLDPISAEANWYLGMALLADNRSDEAIARFQIAVDLDPTYFYAYAFLGRAYLQAGKKQEALKAFGRAKELESENSENLANLAYAQGVNGNTEEARKIINDLEVNSKNNYVAPYYLAIAYAGLGENEQVLKLLESAYDDKSDSLVLYLTADPQMEGIRSDPQYKDLLKRLNMPE